MQLTNDAVTQMVNLSLSKSTAAANFLPTVQVTGALPSLHSARLPRLV